MSKGNGEEPRLQFASSPAAAMWIGSRLLPVDPESDAWRWRVGNEVPSGFERYLRLLHPVELEGGQWCTWKHIADLNHTDLYPLTDFRQVAASADGVRYTGWPRVGTLQDAVRGSLLTVLAGGDWQRDIWCAYWRGWGQLSECLQLLTGQNEWSGTTEEEATFALPWREYLLLRGPLKALQMQTSTPGTILSPQLWWPDDQRWFVATDIDYEYSLIGADSNLASRLLSERALEILEIDWGDHIDT